MGFVGGEFGQGTLKGGPNDSGSRKIVSGAPVAMEPIAETGP